ncbi:MAG: hydrogenase subunit [Candidatus Aenigmarchaeota archaeon]|nr:hydrogenase subunit [Candidatus Aenigmarchaeota archaeon]
MIDAAQGSVEILSVFVLISAAFIINGRDLFALFSLYRLQSFFIFVMAMVLFTRTGSYTTLSLAAITLVSKVLVIPMFLEMMQRKMKIKRDSEFHYLSPTSAIFVSMVMIMISYISLSGVLRELALSNTFFLATVAGVSLTLMGMLFIFSRRQAITNVIGYLTMENGVLLISLFLTELPLIIEALIVLDLFMLVLLATLLAFGIDSADGEEVSPFEKLFGGVK